MSLYQEYFGFREPPFNITPDPEFLYLSASHREALAQLSYGVKARRGFIVLTGEVGTGKTTLVQAFLNELDGNTPIALVFSHIASPLDLLRYICHEFGLHPAGHSRSDLYEHILLLNEYLLEKYRTGENCVLIIDEAQNLSSEVLESVRLLSNFETSKDKLLQIVLVGQPELATRLNSQELRQLKQRITLRHHLRALTLKECQEYVANRLRVAGSNSTLFTARALELLYAYSGGIPRVINVIGDNALLTGYGLGKKYVDDSLILQVAEDLSFSTVVTPSIYPVIGEQLPSRENALATTRDKSNVREFTRQPRMSQTEQRIVVGDNCATASVLLDRVPVRFFDELTKELVEVIGPMASMVLRDHIRRLGQSMNTFPKEKLGTLIEAVSQEVLDSYMRQQFRTAAYRIRQA
jgi:type II secretory pathway predicted ATPase ExeA